MQVGNYVVSHPHVYYIVLFWYEIFNLSFSFGFLPKSIGNIGIIESLYMNFSFSFGIL